MGGVHGWDRDGATTAARRLRPGLGMSGPQILVLRRASGRPGVLQIGGHDTNTLCPGAQSWAMVCWDHGEEGVSSGVSVQQRPPSEDSLP